MIFGNDKIGCIWRVCVCVCMCIIIPQSQRTWTALLVGSNTEITANSSLNLAYIFFPPTSYIQIPQVLIQTIDRGVWLLNFNETIQRSWITLLELWELQTVPVLQSGASTHIDDLWQRLRREHFNQTSFIVTHHQVTRWINTISYGWYDPDHLHSSFSRNVWPRSQQLASCWDILLPRHAWGKTNTFPGHKVMEKLSVGLMDQLRAMCEISRLNLVDTRNTSRLNILF